MRNSLTLSIVVVVMMISTSCRKTYTHSCIHPQFVLEQDGYDETEWDTVVTKVYNKGFMEPAIIDTFMAKALADVLTIYLDQQNLKDFEIILPSVNRIYKLYDIEITSHTVQTTEDNPAACYNDVTYTLDGQSISPPNAAIIYNKLSK